MSKFSDTLQGLAEAKQSVVQSESNWLSFLKMSARMYKHPFDYQLQIHRMRPNATACADFDLWTSPTKLNRHIKLHSTGIPVINTTADHPKLTYLYDISDTEERANGQSINPWVWSVSEEHIERIGSTLWEQYGATGQELSEVIREVAEKASENIPLLLEEALPSDEIKNLMSGSISTVVLSRCGLQEHNAYNMRSISALASLDTKYIDALGRAVTDKSKKILMTIEAVVKAMEIKTERSISNENNRNEVYQRSEIRSVRGERGVDAGYDSEGRDNIYTGRTPRAVSVLSDKPSPAETGGDNHFNAAGGNGYGTRIGEDGERGNTRERAVDASADGSGRIREAGRDMAAEDDAAEREVRHDETRISEDVSAGIIQSNGSERHTQGTSIRDTGDSNEKSEGAVRTDGTLGGLGDGADEEHGYAALDRSDEQLSGVRGGSRLEGDSLSGDGNEINSETADVNTSAVSIVALAQTTTGFAGGIKCFSFKLLEKSECCD